MTEDAVTGKLREIGRGLQSRVRSFFDNPPGPESPPLELLQAALDGLEKKVQSAGRGSRVFPYNRIAVKIAQPGADREAVSAVFRQLEPRLRERLAELRCDPPAALEARVLFLEGAAVGQPVLALECSNEGRAAVLPAEIDGCPPLRVQIVKGQCDQREYTFREPVIAIGRTPDPVDAQGNVRRNDVAFVDTRDGISETVARAHARIQFDPSTGDYHLFNEAGSNPTFIIRGGRSIRVPSRDPRGLRVHPGDEVQLGRAVIRLTKG